MNNTQDNHLIPTLANYVQHGTGTPVIMIHGLAASLHDWNDLVPELSANGYASYALDLLGHGDSPKLDSRAYQILRNTYGRTNLSGLLVGQLPEWLFRFFVDVSSVATGHSIGSLHSLPEKIRAQTALDYKRTAPGVYHIPHAMSDMTEYLPEIDVPTLVVWGDHDQTLDISSFPRLVNGLPKARGEVLRAGHVPHQSHAKDFNQLVVGFLKELSLVENAAGDGGLSI